MPLPDASVGIVFSKNSIVHIPDKERWPAMRTGSCNQAGGSLGLADLP